MRPRPRWLVALLALVTVILGLSSRQWPGALPPFVAAYAGDTLWAAMVFWGLALVQPRRSTATLAMAALAIAVAVEVSQLSHAGWLVALRGTRLGGLVLGYGFLWSDLACYAVGVGMVATLDLVLQRRHAARARTAEGGTP